MPMIQTVLLAIKDKAPALHKSLAASGKLNGYAQELADQINSETVSMTMEDHRRNRWDKLDPMARAAKMNAAKAINREAAMAQVLEFPQDETSPANQDATTSSDPTT